jgi:hypothetical protein
MARKSSVPKTNTVRLSDEAVKWARIASGYTGESVAEYVSRVVAERGREDADRLHAETLKSQGPKPKADPKPPKA